MFTENVNLQKIKNENTVNTFQRKKTIKYFRKHCTFYRDHLTSWKTVNDL